MTAEQAPPPPGPDRPWFHRVLRAVGWPARWILITLIRGYQRFISPMTPPSCRYYPVCSSYGLTAIERHGAVKGTLLTTARVIRCNPWSRGGIDPVPPVGRWRPDVLPDGTPRGGDPAS